jgi:hypothetical protein
MSEALERPRTVDVGRFMEAAATSDLPTAMRAHLARYAVMKTGAGLSTEELMVFLAVGSLGLSTCEGRATRTPVACADVAQLIRVPRETVRRKAGRLVDLGLLEQSSRGLLVRDVDQWFGMASTWKVDEPDGRPDAGIDALWRVRHTQL